MGSIIRFALLSESRRRSFARARAIARRESVRDKLGRVMITKTQTDKIIATNREAYHNFHILETYEAGIELQGTEVKSAREGRVNLKDAYAMARDGQLWLLNAHISHY